MIELVMLGTILAGLVLYALFGGADFGGGVWEFNTALRAPEKERAMIFKAIGPVWEANHVWLIFVITALFTGFPSAFAAICQALWIPMLLALLGIVFRGVGFAYRSHAADARDRALWGGVFAVASTLAPFFLGVCAGTVASGAIQGEPNVFTVWFKPLPLFCGFFGVGVCAYLAAVYLAREAHLLKESALALVWRKRAITVGIVMGVLALVGIGLMASGAPALWDGFRARSWPMVGFSAIAGHLSLVALWRRRYTLAAAGAAATVATVIVGWGLAQYPWIVPPSISIASSKAPDAVLGAAAWSLAAGMALVAPALAWLFVLFKGKTPS